MKALKMIDTWAVKSTKNLIIVTMGATLVVSGLVVSMPYVWAWFIIHCLKGA